MRNFKLTLEYDGTDFHGWQRQRELRTVQGTLEEAVTSLFGKDVQINGAGRTDTGVHALGQVCNFVVETHLAEEQIRKALTKKLPEDIHVYRVEEKDLKFHARFSATGRRYVYYLRTEPSAIWRRFAYVVTTELDVDDMQAAAQYLIGEQDFTSFATARSTSVPTVCDLTGATIKREEEIISVTIEADHFLHHMVRVIVGTLIDVGRGKLPPEHMKEVVCKKDRAASGPTIPPNGLFLMEVRYGD